MTFDLHAGFGRRHAAPARPAAMSCIAIRTAPSTGVNDPFCVRAVATLGRQVTS